MRVHNATARRLTTAARGLRLHAAGQWTGGDGSAARRLLRLLLQPLRPAPRPPSMHRRAAAASPSTREATAARSERMVVPPLGLKLIAGSNVGYADMAWPTRRGMAVHTAHAVASRTASTD